MICRLYQHPSHGRLGAALSNGKAVFTLSDITGIHQLRRFGAEWIASYADKHRIAPIKTKDGSDLLLHETTVLDFISTSFDDADLVDWLINGVIKDLHGIKEPRIAGIPVATDGWTDPEVMNPMNSVSTWLLHPMLAPHLGYPQWIESLIQICTLGRPIPDFQIGKRADGTIAINPILALGLGMEAGVSTARIAFRLIKNHGTLAYHESLTTLDAVLRRHSVMISDKA